MESSLTELKDRGNNFEEGSERADQNEVDSKKR